MEKHKSVKRFVVIFVAVFISYYVMLTYSFFTSFLHNLNNLNAQICVFILKLFNLSFNSFSNIIFTSESSLKIGIGCDRSEPMLVLLASILATKASYLHKFIGILSGFSLVILFNSLRIIALFFLNSGDKEVFYLFHDDILPLVTILISLGIYISWLKVIKK